MLEPGEEILALEKGHYALDLRASRLTIQAWDRHRNFVRRIVDIHSRQRGKLELVVERFARKLGRVTLVDLARPAAEGWERKGARLVFREQLREMLSRLDPDWTIAELSSEADLEHSLSPVYPRALLKKGSAGRAVIAAGPDTAEPSGILSFGLVWLDYLRKREPRLTIDGISLFLPKGQEGETALRLRFLDPRAARYDLFTYGENGLVEPADPMDHGNLKTRLDVFCSPEPRAEHWVERLCEGSEAETVVNPDGSVSARLRGIEFARSAGPEVLFGLKKRALLHEGTLAEARRLCTALAEARREGSRNRGHPLYRSQPERWLESRVRAQIGELDATLLASPVYGQVPAVAGTERSVIDLLAADRRGRLTVVELKASADLHLPLQALDYWIRVQWHVERGEFSGRGYFPGLALVREAPRLLLVSPALEFHPTTETILRYFSARIPVERIGVAGGWRRDLRVMFRSIGAATPD